ncbi:MAG: hypothetical protein K2I33_01105, partial [Oscillospiraceae bacterium]|nr:hypothetical protein [Oscillospiraceae bacterium]
SLQKQDLTIKPFNESSDNQEDPVESSNSGDSSNVGGNNNSQSSNVGNDSNSNDTNSGNDNNSSSVGGNDNVTPSVDASSLLNTTDVVIMPGGNDNDNQSNNNNPGDNTIAGTKRVMQVWWLDLSKQQDFVFDGEFITADFKIKEGTANGTYPVTVEWLDFSCWEGKGVAFNGTDGSVVVGSEAKANSFRNDGSPEIMIENVSGKPGDTVTVRFQMKNNPGIVACIFRFAYDSDALEYIGGGEGADFEGTFS